MNKLQQLRKEAIERHERLMAYIDRHEDFLAPLLQEVEKLEPTRVDVDDCCANLSISGDKHKLNAVFGLLRRHGYVPNDRPKAGQSSYSSFFHKHGDEEAPMVWLSFSSTQCRRVKVGTRTVTREEDIFEVVCDEQQYPERDEAPEVAA